MKDLVQRLLVTGAAVVAFGLAPQVSAQQSSEGIECPDAAYLKEICESGNFDIVRLENIDNTPPITCGCPGITVEQCSDAVCSNFGEQILDTDASRVSYGDGLKGSKCRKETTCLVPPIGGDLVCETKKICKN